MSFLLLPLGKESPLFVLDPFSWIYCRKGLTSCYSLDVVSQEVPIQERRDDDPSSRF